MKKINVFQKLILLCTVVGIFNSCSTDEVSPLTNGSSKGILLENASNFSARGISLEAQLKEYEQAFKSFSTDLKAYKDGISKYSESQQAILLESYMQPFAAKTRALLENYNITDSDIEDSFGSSYSTEIITVGIYILWNESVNQVYTTNIDWGQVVGCAIAALGFNVFDEIRAGVALTRTVVLRVFKTAASRMLGPIGLAITVAEFGICMM